MKRYDFKAHFDPYYGCDVAEPEEHSDGEWVKASVAQALYDALVKLRSEAKLIQFDVVDNGIDDAIYGADSALSLADCEE